MHLVRLASFKPIVGYNSARLQVSFLTLSSAGFRFTGNGSVVQCDGCGQIHDLEVLVPDGSMRDPSQRLFHADQCPFISSGSYREANDKGSEDIEQGNFSGKRNSATENNGCFKSSDFKYTVTMGFNEDTVTTEINLYTSNTGSNVDTLTAGSNEVIMLAGQTHESEMESLTKTITDSVHNTSCDVWATSVVRQHPHKDGNRAESSISYLNNSVMCQSSQSNLGDADSEVASGTGFSLIEDAGYVSDDSDPVFVDKALFEFEYASISNVKSTRAINKSDCKKNPGHFAYFPMHGIKEQQLPSKCRYPEVIQFLQLLGILTVRVVISVTSKDRSRDDPALRHSLGTAQQRQRAGTGFITLSEQESLREDNQPLDESHNGNWGNLKKYMKNLVSKSKELIYVETNRHLVYNDEEASNTTVEFFYDDPSQRGVKVVKGVGVIHSQIVGEHRSVLVCRTSDHDLVHLLSKTRREVMKLTERLPRRAMEAMCKKMFIIHHPHGGEKILSYGDSVVVRYDLRKDNRGRVNMTKIKNSLNVQVKANVRKVLLYAADTCEGSSGAPVFTFKRGSTDGQGQASLVLDVWMHNGVEKTHKLGGSVMKVCTADEFEVRQTPDTSPQSADSDDDDEPGHQEVSSPVFKVLTHPSYPVYITYQKRLDSYGSWKFSLIHSPEYLAKAGFFYAGYSDCVRCFQCGLGLRSWRPGDDVIEQHQKHRPNCPYLQAHGSLDKETPRTESSGTIEGKFESNVEKNITLTLLENENMKLQEQLTCKVCHKEPVKDLFLPCGELYACTECSKLLTHCPSCHKQILATVTTYFS